MSLRLMQKIWVKATPIEKDPGLKGKHRVTRERAPNRYITEDKWTEVVLTSYYWRKIQNKELECSEVNPNLKGKKVG